MTLHQSIEPKTVKGVAVGATPQSLSAIKKPDCAAALWQREPLVDFQNWIDRLPENQLPKARIILRPGHVEQALKDLMGSHAIAPYPLRKMLIEDMTALAHIFADVMEAPFLRLRLDVVTTNACRKFHVDVLTARLICTYRGTGTQYGLSSSGADPDRIFTAPTGSPLILRGRLWPAETETDLLHRSPPIEGTGEARLVLILDPISDQEEAKGNKVLH